MLVHSLQNHQYFIKQENSEHYTRNNGGVHTTILLATFSCKKLRLLKKM